MKNLPLSLGASLSIVSLILGVGIGYSLTPEYRETMYMQMDMGLDRADALVDLRYLNTMIAHHRSAMLLAEQALASQRPEIRDLAAMILRDEPPAIDELYAWKRAWYRDTRRVQDPRVAHLGSWDASFDLRFLNALIAHHEEGILMTQDVRRSSSRQEVITNADAVETFLRTTGQTLRTWRGEWYPSTR